MNEAEKYLFEVHGYLAIEGRALAAGSSGGQCGD